ncbi:MAG: UvrD-helicase domain-containing protein [Anaerolineae bacterium]|nr:UvrD-helicase domain-containing protein [Anaerolineae bacterium]
MADTRLPNPAQAHAIDQIDSNIAVTAGAGSGKTTVLVGRYLNLLASGRRVGELVAITFTRKAAAEMSARLREALEKRLSETTDSGLRQRFTVALQDMNAARISTIHSLCGDIVRANAAQCGIDPSFAVLDEVQGRVMFSVARERVLRTLGAVPDDSTGAQAARAVVRAYGLNTVRSALKVELLAQAAEGVSIPLTADELLDSWRGMWLEVAASGCADLAASVEQTLTGFAIPADDKLTEHVVSARQAVDLLRSALSADLMAGLAKLKTVSLTGGSAKNWVTVDMKAVKEALKSARERADQLIKVLGSDIDSDINREAVGHLVGWREIVRRVVEMYREAKRRQNALDFNDLEALAGRVLADDAVAARYQNQFKQVMVDEFQDTSAAQWEIIRRLAPPDQPGRLFIVGDPKQSIYGFRGSDHTVFTHATEGIRASGLLQSPIVNTAVALDTSYRTHAPLLSSLNTLFEGVMTVPAGSDGAGYVPFEPLHPGRVGVKGAAPFLRIRRFDETQLPLSGIEKWSAETVREQEAADLSEQVEALVAAGFRYGEMAVLLRARTRHPVHHQRGARLLQSARGGRLTQPDAGAVRRRR